MTHEELQKALEAIGKGGITVNGDLVLSKQVENEIGNVEAGGIGIQNVYSDRKPKAVKPKPKSVAKSVCGKPLTLKYYTHGNKGYLRKQKERVKLVFRKWNEWGWISSEVTTDDFDALFEGVPRHCNIDWKRNSTILSMLMRDLLEYQNRHGENMIEKQTGQSATSMVEQQFGKTANFDEKRLTGNDKFKIHLTIYLLDPENPLPQRKGGGDEDYDLSDPAMLELLAGHLRSTKGI